VGLNSSVVAGLFSGIGQDRLSLVYRQAISPKFQQSFSGRIQVGGSEAFIEPVLLRTSAYFEPAVIEAEWQRDFGPLKASAGLAYQIWSAYQPAYLVVTTEGRMSPHETRQPDLHAHDTWNPRISIEVPFFRGQVALGAGYSFHPSPLGDLSGAGNLLDSDTHIFALGVQHRLEAGTLFPFPLRYGVYGQYHRLTVRSVTKREPDFVGAPGFEFSGNTFVYGLALQAEL
jgi:hypothetical protein